MISVTSPQQILQNPLNDSPSKFHWSFGRAPRFAVKKAICDTYYDMPNTKNKRSTSFGNGNRSSFLLTVDSPSPQIYNLTSCFNETVKGTSFGKNRQECQQQGYIPTGPLQNPGPGTYKDNKGSSVKYSMRPRTAYPSTYFINDTEKTLVPGPGTYPDTLCMNSKGYMSSRVRNANRTTLSFNEKRFKSSESLTPGPAAYNDKNVIRKDGKYFLSTNRSDGRRSFLQDKRQLRLDGNRYTPGPGTYRMPSDFGHYEKIHFDTIDSTLNKSVRSKRPMTARR